MDQIREEHLEEQILELFKQGNMLTIVLTGKAGIGKSRMARKVSLRALKDGIFDVSLWIYMSVKQSKRILYHNIARQLSILSTLGELESDETLSTAETVDEEEDLEGLRKKILVRLSQHRLLLILDDEGKKMYKEDKEIKTLLRFLLGNSSKLLITSVNGDGRHRTEDRKIVIDLKPLSPEKSFSLFQEKAGSRIFEIPGAKLLVNDFINQNIGLTPAEVVIIAKQLSYHQHDSGVQDLECVLDEVYSHNQLALSSSNNNYTKVPTSVLLDINNQGCHFFRDRGAIHYSELIAYWMLEGYLGVTGSVKEAYENGHGILMELMDLQILKKVDADFFMMDRLTPKLKGLHSHGFHGVASLGLANLFSEASEWHECGEAVEIDGIIRTPGTEGKGGKQSTLLLDGNCLSEQDLQNFLESDEELQILGLFHSRLKCLPASQTAKGNLNVLVLRGCDYFEKIGNITSFRRLTALEISNARSLSSIPQEFFRHLSLLRSLNLSALQIEVLPTSLYDLTELQWLILRGCSNIKSLRKMRKWGKLEVLDLSDAVSFRTFAEASFKSLPKLQFLDLSNTKINFLPFLREIGQITHLSVRGCRSLHRLPSIKSLTKLLVLDLSGSSIKEFQDQSFPKTASLEKVDLSRTAISSLPLNIDTRHLFLKGCSQIGNINCFESPENLEVLDFSGASSLVNIEVQFFERMENLEVLNLSRTKVKVLPPLSNLKKLRQLLLSGCSDLLKLPALSFLSKLQVLDLSGCRSLTMLEDKTFGQLSRLQQLDLSGTNIIDFPEFRSLSNLKKLNLSGLSLLRRADFLEHMTKLQILDLSETMLEKLPTLLCSENLTHLSLRNCSLIETLPNLEKFTKLEVLDLSGTSLSHLPSLKDLRNLHKLLLKHCSGLKKLADIQTLDLFGMVVEDLPHGISVLTQLEHLILPNTKNNQESESNKAGCSIEQLKECQWAISSLTGKDSVTNRVLVSLYGSEFLGLLEQNPSLWDTNFKDFHFSVSPIEPQNGTGGIYFHRNEYILKDIYFQSKHLHHLEGEFPLLEIRGFHSFPKGVETILSHAKHIFLFDNSFIISLADLGTEILNVMKGCWLERCQNLESLTSEDSVGMSIELGKNLEFLWISYALNLKSLYSENLLPNCFQNLKYLLLDCCPGLSSIFSSSQFLQNLEILHIGFCDRMDTLFDNYEKHTLPELHTLRLWEMAELKSIGCIMPSLQFLEVGNCPKLEYILSLTCMPEKLQVLKVKFSDNLRSLLDGSTAENCKLPSLHKLQLWGLQELTSIGLDLTSVSDSSIKDCPKLKNPFP